MEEGAHKGKSAYGSQKSYHGPPSPIKKKLLLSIQYTEFLYKTSFIKGFFA